MCSCSVASVVSNVSGKLSKCKLNGEILWCMHVYTCVYVHAYEHMPEFTCLVPKKLRPTSVQFSSIAQSCLALCDPMNHSTPGLPVHHQLLEFTQTHVHWVGDAIQPSQPLSSPSPPTFNLSQHQGLFKWVSSLHQVAKVLEFQTHIVKYIYVNFRALYICLNLTRAGKPKSADNLHLKLPLLNVSWCYCEIDSAQPLCLL